MVLWRTGGMNEVRDLQLSKNAIFHMIMYLILNVQLSLPGFFIAINVVDHTDNIFQ